MSIYEIITPQTKLPVYFDIFQANNQLIPNHWHNYLEILYLFEGTMHIVINNKDYTLHSNDLFVINTGEIHFTRSNGNIKVLLLQIPDELLNQCIPHLEMLRFSQYYPSEKKKEDPVYQKLFFHLMQMWTLYEKAKDNYQFLFTSELYLFLHTLYSHFSTYTNPVETNKSTKHLGRLKKIIDYVEQNYQEAISLNEIASLVALNPEYFCRFFKKYMGFTFVTYVNLVRLAHIHNDILQTDDNITLIQERHGFTNYKVFNRMFKETYGCQPSKLRAQK